jgi:hypothetical protein
MHLPFSPGTTSDDRLAESVIPLLRKKIVITEKLDGENNSMINKGVFARSHTDFTISPWSQKVRELHSIIKDSISEGLYLFGEGMAAIHSIEYENLTSAFYLFGARYDGIWSSWEEVEDYAFLLDIPTVPVLFKGEFDTDKQLISKVMQLVSEPSALGGLREGIVIRCADSFTDEEFPNSLMKWVRRGHVQTTEHWTRSWKKAEIKNKWEK